MAIAHSPDVVEVPGRASDAGHDQQPPRGQKPSRDWSDADEEASFVKQAAIHGGLAGASASVGICAAVGGAIAVAGSAERGLPVWVPVLLFGAALAFVTFGLVVQRRLDERLVDKE